MTQMTNNKKNKEKKMWNQIMRRRDNIVCGCLKIEYIKRFCYVIY